MAIRLLPGDIYEFDTAAEAVEFATLRAAGNGAAPRVPRRPPGNRPTLGRNVQGFVDALAHNQRTIIEALRKGPSGTDDIAHLIGTTAGALGPTLRHLRRRAAEFGLNGEQIIITERRTDERGKPISSLLRLGSELVGNTS